MKKRTLNECVLDIFPQAEKVKVKKIGRMVQVDGVMFDSNFTLHMTIHRLRLYAWEFRVMNWIEQQLDRITSSTRRVG